MVEILLNFIYEFLEGKWLNKGKRQIGGRKLLYPLLHEEEDFRREMYASSERERIASARLGGG